jgi:transcriptional regulator with XRE-family HTH domain
MDMERKFCDKMIQLRRERGMSQEQLADLLEVSRQAVSKWEGDQSMPSIDKIVQLADLFGVSVDYLIRDSTLQGNSHLREDAYEKSYSNAREDMFAKGDSNAREDRYSKGDANTRQETNTQDSMNTKTVIDQLNELTQMVRNKKTDIYEYKSKRTIAGLPLVHVKFSRYGKPTLAKGIIAIGSVSVGLISLGAISAGLISFGALSFGLLLALGAIVLGSISFGAVSIGLFACGGVAIGIYAFGGVALASKVAVGGVASAAIAIGDAVSGDQTFDIAVATKASVKQVILETYPRIPRGILNLILMAVKK